MTRVRPSRATLVALVVALFGVALVISRGHPSTLWSGSLGWGDVLVLGGVLSFVLYTIGAANHRDLSALRYTTLTAALGWPGDLRRNRWREPPPAGARLPPRQTCGRSRRRSLYLAIPGAVLAVLTWNAAVELIGPQTTSLFGNLIPISTFAIEMARGYRPGLVELLGAVLTIGALVTDNLLKRRAARPAEPEHAAREASVATT